MKENGYSLIIDKPESKTYGTNEYSSNIIEPK